MDRLLLSFTPDLSKKLIARGIAALPEVKRALAEGKIFISSGTTNSYLYVELCGSAPEVTLACGVVTPKGLCIGHGMTGFLESHGHASFWLLDRGQIVEAEDLHGEIVKLSAGDLFFKGANAIDSRGRAGVMLGNPSSGGLMGQSIGHITAYGVHFIIPVGLEKTISGSIEDNAKEMGISRVDYSAGMPVGMLPLPGRVFTEIQAIESLAGVEAIHVGSGGIDGAEGSVTLLIKGERAEVEKVMALYRSCERTGAGMPSGCTGRCAPSTNGQRA